uniref:Retinoic acid receptor responder 1 n=1 Tax=Otus sunia TaxID=257818 RepID=A0A8C8AAR1_9STRI
MLNRSGPKTQPWGTPLLTGHQSDLTPFTTTLWAQPSNHFFTQRSVCPSKPRAASFGRRMLWETLSKALLKPSHQSISSACPLPPLRLSTPALPENAGSCLATVLYRRTKSSPVVNIKCMHTKDQKQVQEEDNRLYQKIRHQTKPIIGNNIPDSYGHIEPALEPAWALAVTGSSYMMWEKSTESLGYFLAQVKSVKQWVNDFIEFDYTVLLHEVPTQEIISCHMRLTWLPGHPLKVKYFCASENQGLEDGSGMESGSAAGILHGKGANF